MMKTKLLKSNPNTVNTSNNSKKEGVNQNGNNNNNNSKQNDDLMIESTTNNSNNVRKLKSPYIKFESVCKQYKPIYFEFKQWQDITLAPETNNRNNNSPFQKYFSEE